MNTGKLWTPLDAESIQDPYPMYARLREQDPVHHAQTGEWIISRYDDVKTILKSPLCRSGNRLEWLSRGVTQFRNRDEDFRSIYSAINTFILFLNAPDHGQIRNLVAKAWDNHEVEKSIEQRAMRLIEKIETPEFDLIKTFAQPLPVSTISAIMGITERDHDYLSGMSIRMLRSLDLYHTYKDLVELNETSKAFVDYFRMLIQTKTDNPDEGLISKLILQNRQGVVTTGQLVSLGIFLFLAGEETTSSSISTGLYNLMLRPDLYKHLRENPQGTDLAVEELFRYDPPVHILGRINKSELVVAGKTIPENSVLTLLLASANRDPSQFHDADQLRLQRNPNHHLAFGTGVHFCLGDWLGRIQTKIAIALFTQAFSKAEVLSQPVRWNKNLAVRGLASLYIKVER